MLRKAFAVAPLLTALCLSLPAHAADVSVANAWVRATVAGQKVTGAFMDLSSTAGATLVGAASPAGGVTQIHEMSMDGGVMRMRETKALPLPAGERVALKPGGYHVMLMDLKKPLTPGETVPITLKIQAKDGKLSDLEVKAEVRSLSGMAMDHHHH